MDFHLFFLIEIFHGFLGLDLFQVDLLLVDQEVLPPTFQRFLDGDLDKGRVLCFEHRSITYVNVFTGNETPRGIFRSDRPGKITVNQCFQSGRFDQFHFDVLFADVHFHFFAFLDILGNLKRSVNVDHSFRVPVLLSLEHRHR